MIYWIIGIIVVFIVIMLLFLLFYNISNSNNIPKQGQGINSLFVAEVSNNIGNFTERQKDNIVPVPLLGEKPIIVLKDSYPEIFDSYRDHSGLITLPLDQTLCGDCYTFATATSISDILRIATKREFPNIHFPLYEYTPWIFTLHGTTIGSLRKLDDKTVFDLTNVYDFAYTTLNNISPFALMILEPDYDFISYTGRNGSICDGGEPQLILEVVLGPNIKIGQCRSVSIPSEFPFWVKARFVYVDISNIDKISDKNILNSDSIILDPNSELFTTNSCGMQIPKDQQNNIVRKYLDPTVILPNQVLDRDECCNILSGGCPVTTSEDLIHKYIPSLLTGFECNSVSSKIREEIANFEKYCTTSERIASLYFTQIPFGDFNYQIDGYEVLIQRNTKNPSEIISGNPSTIEKQIMSYVMDTGPIIVNMIVPTNFITWFPMYNSEQEYHQDVQNKFKAYGTGRLYYPVGSVSMNGNSDNNSNNTPTLTFPTLPVFSESSTSRIGIHSVNIIGWGICENSNHDRQKYWLVRNSWGILWGNKGTFMILDKDNQVGTYITSLSTVAVNVSNQPRRIAEHFSNYKLRSTFENPLNINIVKQLFTV